MWALRPNLWEGAEESTEKVPVLEVTLSSVRSDSAVEDAFNLLFLYLIRVQPFSTRWFSKSSDNKILNAVMLRSPVSFSRCPVHPSVRTLRTRAFHFLIDHCRVVNSASVFSGVMMVFSKERHLPPTTESSKLLRNLPVPTLHRFP